MKRLFIAVPIHETSRIEIVQGILTDSNIKKMPVRWTAIQNLHLTLQFLGDIEEKDITKITAILDNINSPIKNEKLVFTKVGAFPSSSAPRILWIGIEKNDYLLKIQQYVTRSLDEAGFTVDHKRFKPHLTLGRVRENGSLPIDAFTYIEEIRNGLNVSDSSLDRVTLFESCLRPGGPIYTTVYEKMLNIRNLL